MFCPTCGIENPDNARFCKNCGSQFTAAAPPPPPPAYTPPPAPPPPPAYSQPPAPPPMYTPPPAAPAGMGLTREQALAKVKLPAIFLIVVAALNTIWQLISIILNVIGTGMSFMGSASSDMPPEVAAMMSGGIGIVVSIIAILLGVVILLGAFKMMKLQSWPFALIATIIAMIPCIWPCCCIGPPIIGIWSLIVLLNKDVKAAFA